MDFKVGDIVVPIPEEQAKYQSIQGIEKFLITGGVPESYTAMVIESTSEEYPVGHHSGTWLLDWCTLGGRIGLEKRTKWPN